MFCSPLGFHRGFREKQAQLDRKAPLAQLDQLEKLAPLVLKVFKAKKEIRERHFLFPSFMTPMRA